MDRTSVSCNRPFDRLAQELLYDILGRIVSGYIDAAVCKYGTVTDADSLPRNYVIPLLAVSRRFRVTTIQLLSVALGSNLLSEQATSVPESIWAPVRHIRRFYQDVVNCRWELDGLDAKAIVQNPSQLLKGYQLLWQCLSSLYNALHPSLSESTSQERVDRCIEVIFTYFHTYMCVSNHIIFETFQSRLVDFCCRSAIVIYLWKGARQLEQYIQEFISLEWTDAEVVMDPEHEAKRSAITQTIANLQRLPSRTRHTFLEAYAFGFDLKCDFDGEMLVQSGAMKTLEQAWLDETLSQDATVAKAIDGLMDEWAPLMPHGWREQS